MYNAYLAALAPQLSNSAMAGAKMNARPATPANPRQALGPKGNMGDLMGKAQPHPFTLDQIMDAPIGPDGSLVLVGPSPEAPKSTSFGGTFIPSGDTIIPPMQFGERPMALPYSPPTKPKVDAADFVPKGAKPKGLAPMIGGGIGALLGLGGLTSMLNSLFSSGEAPEGTPTPAPQPDQTPAPAATGVPSQPQPQGLSLSDAAMMASLAAQSAKPTIDLEEIIRQVHAPREAPSAGRKFFDTLGDVASGFGGRDPQVRRDARQARQESFTPQQALYADLLRQSQGAALNQPDALARYEQMYRLMGLPAQEAAQAARDQAQLDLVRAQTNLYNTQADGEQIFSSEEFLNAFRNRANNQG